MSIKSQAHISAMSDLVERITIAGVMALIADTFWCFRDTMGLAHGWLYVIMTVLFIATCITIHALYQYHMAKYKEHLDVSKKAAMKVCKAKAKRGAK